MSSECAGSRSEILGHDLQNTLGMSEMEAAAAIYLNRAATRKSWVFPTSYDDMKEAPTGFLQLVAGHFLVSGYPGHGNFWPTAEFVDRIEGTAKKFFGVEVVDSWSWNYEIPMLGFRWRLGVEGKFPTWREELRTLAREIHEDVANTCDIDFARLRKLLDKILGGD